MKLKTLYIYILFIVTYSCESEANRNDKLIINKHNTEDLNRHINKKSNEDSIFGAIGEKIARQKAIVEEKKRKERELYNKYGNNSLPTGSTPYAYCFGKNKSCNHNGCSQIRVKTPYNSDVLVTIKRGEKVFRHAYIQAGDSYIFEVPNGTYQTFFYYGKGWYPEKFMKVTTTCDTLKGGFLKNEYFGKDSPQSLYNNILTYELILQPNGNFMTRPSSKDEAF